MGYALRSFATYVDALGADGAAHRIEAMASWARRPNNASDDALHSGTKTEGSASLCAVVSPVRAEVPRCRTARLRQRGPALDAPHLHRAGDSRVVGCRASSVPLLRGVTYATLFGLLAATGLRLSEALRYLSSGCRFEVRPAPGAPDQVRQVQTAGDPTTLAALRRYASRRDRRSRVPTRRRSLSARAVGVRGACLRLRQVDRVFPQPSRTNWGGSTAAPMPHPVFMTVT